MIIKAIMTVVMMLFVPILSGITICQLFSIRKGLPGYYLFGNLAEMAFIQLISVPLILLRQKFTLIVILVSAFLFFLSITGICFFVRRIRKHEHTVRKRIRAHEVFAFVIMVVGYIAMALAVLFLQTKSFDDSRFVVTAVDIVHTDRMFLTNPNTGLEIGGFFGDMHRDAVSPWAVYIAYCAKTTGFFATTMAHTIMPQFLMLCMLSVYWMIADTFFHNELFSKCAMVFIALLVNVYGGYTGYNTETFALTRIWQGKAAVAAIGIPTAFLAFSWVYSDPDKGSGYILVYMIALAMCLMSGMGIIISGIMCAGFGIAYMILKKRVTMGIKIWITVLIPLLYYGISKLNY